MKRWLAVLAIGILLVGIGLSVFAGPIGVGGTLTASSGQVAAAVPISPTSSPPTQGRPVC